MEKMRDIIIGMLVAIGLTGCEKDISIDYHDMEQQLYVVEGLMSNIRTIVRVSKTQPMTGAADSAYYVADATVVVTAGDTLRDTLAHTGRGYYAATRLSGKPGTTYQLDVSVGGRRFTSTSVMQQQPVMNSFRFVWKEVFGRRILFADVRLQDIAGETNYYYLHLYRNDLAYRSAVIRDRGNPGGELQQLFSLCMEDDLNGGSPTSRETLWENDRLKLEVRSIDRRAYDYLYSTITMESSNTNPIANFSGGCLGYFSAFGQTTHYYTFHEADIEKE